MSKHTPGPWFHHGPSGSQHTAGGFINSTKERNGSPLVCSVYGNDEQPHQANSNLIAAAPDLLEALEGMMQVYGGGTPWNPLTSTELELHDLARKAIAKARGES